jgi:hypothetical protein
MFVRVVDQQDDNCKSQVKERWANVGGENSGWLFTGTRVKVKQVDQHIRDNRKHFIFMELEKLADCWAIGVEKQQNRRPVTAL